MAFFRNPMVDPWSARRKVSFLLYLIFLAASVWACGGSLARTLGAAKILCYILAFAALATASFCLGLVKVSVGRGFVSNRSIKLLVGAVGFVILWFAILMANTHNIYYVMTVSNQRQKELRNVRNQLELIGDKSIAAFNEARSQFEDIIATDIKNMKEEILNPNNRGRGEKAESIVNRIEEKLGVRDIEMPTNPPRDFNGLRQYAESLASKIREITREKLSRIDEKISQLNTFLRKEDYQNTQKMLDVLITNFDTKSEREITQGLRNSYSMYKKAQEYIEQLFKEPLIRENTNLSIERLPDVPVSIESEDIAYSWGEFFKRGSVNIPRFWWAISIAFILDLACFLFWYFGVLPDEE
jgi:hypothetical protein